MTSGERGPAPAGPVPHGPVARARLVAVTGDALRAHLPTLAQLRIQVFRDFPYLYVGDVDYEQRYLETYVQAPGAVIVLALVPDGQGGERAVGASTGLPLTHEPMSLQAPLRQVAGLDPARVFYFGESVLDPAYRGQGLGVGFFAEREAHARALGGFTHAAFCAVIRPADHPRRPPDHVPLDAFWMRRGFRRLEGAVTHFPWQDLDESGESLKPMAYWIKALD